MLDKKDIENKLKQYNQEHIIEIIEKMDSNEQQNIIKQILEIDFEKMAKLYKSTKIKQEMEEDKITPIDYIDKQKIDSQELKEIKKIGEQIIKDNEYAVVTMAGRTRNKTWL